MVIIRRTFFLKWFKKSPKNEKFWRFLAFRKASKPEEISKDKISQEATKVSKSEYTKVLIFHQCRFLKRLA